MGEEPPSSASTPPPDAGPLDPANLLPDRAVATLLATLDPTARLAPDAGAALAGLASEFVADVLAGASAAARARRGETLGPGDVAAAAAVGWNVRAPGGGGDAVRPYRRRAPSAAHAARAAAVARAAEEG